MYGPLASLQPAKPSSENGASGSLDVRHRRLDFGHTAVSTVFGLLVFRFRFLARKLRRIACGPPDSYPYPHTRSELGSGTIPDLPLSVFAASRSAYSQQRIRLCFLLAGLGAVSLAIGFLQMAQGSASSLRFYEFTNPSEAVGFFANRNHFAALLNVTLVLAAVWLWMTANAALRRGALGNRSVLWLGAAAAFLVADAAGLAMARSRAGIFLAIVALIGIVSMAYKQTRATGRDRRHTSSSRISLAAAVFAVLFAAQFGLGSMLSRFEGDPLEDLRFALNQTTFKTAFKALPFGTGLGSFVRVYATVEKKEDAFAGFANRAHNDAAELLLETGVLGAALLLAFLAWYAKCTYRAWTGRRAAELLRSSPCSKGRRA